MRISCSALILAGVAGLHTASPAFAADAAPSPHTLTANVYLVTDYYFRGITQTWHRPALQGGADYSHASGLYAGAWGSNVSGNQYPGGSSLELDYYFGYNGKLGDDFGWTVGGYGYYYPGANYKYGNPAGADQKFDSFEWNAGLSYKWISVKYSRMITDWFGVNTSTGYGSNSRGSSYLEANVSYEFAPSWTIGLHAAHTDVKTTIGGLNPDYNDYKISLGKALENGWNVSLAYAKSSYADANVWKPAAGYASLLGNGIITDPGEGRFILSAGRLF